MNFNLVLKGRSGCVNLALADGKRGVSGNDDGEIVYNIQGIILASYRVLLIQMVFLSNISKNNHQKSNRYLPK